APVAIEAGDAELRHRQEMVGGVDGEVVLGVRAVAAVVLRMRAVGAILEVGAVPAAVDRRRIGAIRARERLLLRRRRKDHRRGHDGKALAGHSRGHLLIGPRAYRKVVPSPDPTGPMDYPDVDPVTPAGMADAAPELERPVAVAANTVRNDGT